MDFNEDIMKTINSASVNELRKMASKYANELTQQLLDKGRFVEEIDEIKQITGQKKDDKIYILSTATKTRLRYITYNLYQKLEGVDDSMARYSQHMNTFLSKRKDYTKEMWRQVVDILGALGPDAVEKYGSDQIVNDYAVYKEAGFTENDILNAIDKTVKNSKGADTNELARKVSEELRALSEKNRRS